MLLWGAIAPGYGVSKFSYVTAILFIITLKLVIALWRPRPGGGVKNPSAKAGL